MKYTFIILLLFKLSFSGAQLTKERKSIDFFCKQIDNDSSLNKRVYSQEAFMEQVTDNGGELTIYFKNNIVYRITEWVGLSFGVIINNYYFQNKQLVFVSDEELMYERNPVTGEITGNFSKDNRFYGRYYFKNGKLIDEESLGHNRFEDDEHHDAEKEFLLSAKKYLNIFYKK